MTSFTKNKTPFSSDFLAQIKETLLKEKERLEKELATISVKTAGPDVDYEATMPNYGDSEEDNAREVAEYTVNKPLELTFESALRDVLKSLSRLEEGTYGMCKYCGNPIEEKRLLARPTSSSCVECKKTLTQEA